MVKYAEGTRVSTQQSRNEIERVLTRYGAETFFYAAETEKAIIGFRLKGRMIRFVLKLPNPRLREFTHHSRGARTAQGAFEAWEAACRQKWRALLLVIKAKLEAVESGITTIEAEFLAATLLPDGSTVGDWAKEKVDEAYLTGEMPTSLMLTAPKG